MFLRSRVIRTAAAVTLVLLSCTPAFARVTRTYVSGVGDDANPCSRTAPCKTFAGAISKTNAGGYIDVLDVGGFGTVTITKSLTIDGGGFLAGVLAAGGVNGIIINGANIRVVLRNLDIEGAGSGNHGINVINAGSVHLEHIHIVGFANNGVNFNPSGSGAVLYADDVSVRLTATAISVQNGRAEINRSRVEQSTNGFVAAALSNVTVNDSTASGNGFGFLANAATANLNIANCVATHNTNGITANAVATIRVSSSNILANTTRGLFNDGSSSIISLSGNSVEGNPTPGVFTSTILKQ